ncbi:MAG: hypothetical protein U9N53_14585, partial [Bacteroidota bacterium]|nr:hypothetical protein [Bacteroidota bacterium]
MKIQIDRKIHMIRKDLQVLILALSFSFLSSSELAAQSSRYWSTNLNEESSMLAGAVVGGGAGVGAIYYNPAWITENQISKFSFNANLVSLQFYKLTNALGEGIDLQTTKFNIQPRFLSFLLKPKNMKDMSFQVVILNKSRNEVELTHAQDINLDILQSLPGIERYYANFKFRKRYNEDWVGIGTSYEIKPGFSIGISMFGTAKSLRYNHSSHLYAFPLTDTIFSDTDTIPFYTANNSSSEYIRYNNYRILWKIGLGYKSGSISMGLNISTPSINIYSDGKIVSKLDQQENIIDPSGSGFLQNYLIADEQVKDEISINHKDPLSIAFGLNYRTPNGKHKYFFTMEYFSKLNAYTIIDANINPNITTGSIYNELVNKKWLSYNNDARHVVNFAVGYESEVSEDVMIMGGFKTDFSAKHHYSFANSEGFENQIRTINADFYHLTGGGLLNVKGHRIFAGLQY